MRVLSKNINKYVYSKNKKLRIVTNEKTYKNEKKKYKKLSNSKQNRPLL